jgi:phage-related tail fiber protein
MSQTRIRGNGQVIPLTITDNEVAALAGIQLSKLQNGSKIVLSDGTVAFTAPVSGVDPTLPAHFATKNYVDSVKQSLDIKDSVRVATVGANIALSGGAPNSIDGVALALNNRILVKDQTTASQNGIYVVQTVGTGANGVWVRAIDADQNAEVTSGLYVFVEEGATNGTSGWVLSTTGTIVVGTTNLSFTQFSGAGQITAGVGLSKTGNTLSVLSANTGRIAVSAFGIDLATTGIAAGSYFLTTVDAYGRATSGSNPTTLAGFGITDAQPLDSDLTAIGGLSTTGLIARTGNGSAASRILTAPSTGFTITNGDGVAGNPTFVLANDLGALEGLNGIGIAVRTSSDTWAQRTVAGTAGRITVAQGDGVAGNPTIDLATSGVGAGTYKSVTVDAYGRVTAGTNPTTLSGYGITDAVNKTGDTMTGFLTLNADPVNPLHAVTKQYVDAVQQALDLKASVVAATTTNVTLAGGAPTIVDGVTLTTNARVLVKAQTNGAENGIYMVQTLGTGANGTWIRTTDADTNTKVTPGLYTFVEQGVLNADSGWVLTTDGNIVLGTTSLSFTQFSGAGQVIAGAGITKSGNQLDVNSANAGITVNADNIALALDGTTLSISALGLKLADLPNGKILVGNSSNVATAVSMSGDATMNNAGVVTLNPVVLKATNFIIRETPAGAIDGINTTFTLAYTPVAGTETLFANGIMLEPGTGNDYTIAGATITMLFALQPGDRLKANYVR